jgi:hypothetical protein
MVNEVVNGLLEEGIIKSYLLGEKAKDFPIRFAFTHRRDGRLCSLDAICTVCPVEIAVFKGRGGGKDDIGITGCVRHKSLMDNREKVFSGKSPQDLVLIGRDSPRVGMIDIEALNRRMTEVIQGPTEAIHVNDSGLLGHEIFPQDLIHGKGS